MKKVISLLLGILIVLSFCACNSSNENFQEPINFYYCTEEITYNTKHGVVKPEIREGIIYSNNVQMMLRAYLEGPIDSSYVSYIPSEAKLVSFQRNNTEAFVTFSEEFAELTGIKLTTACSCVAMTISEYCGVDVLYIRAENSQLDNKDAIKISIADIVLMDELS